MQRLCHAGLCLATAGGILFGASVMPVFADPSTHDYPTHARVEYVNECIGQHQGRLASLYQCSCAIDRIAQALTYDEFVAASTFAKYSGLPGERSGVFRDPDEAKKLAQLFKDTEAAARRECGLEA